MTPRTGEPAINPAYADADLDIRTGTGQPINVGPAPRRFFPIIFKRQQPDRRPSGSDPAFEGPAPARSAGQ